MLYLQCIYSYNQLEICLMLAVCESKLQIYCQLISRHCIQFLRQGMLSIYTETCSMWCVCAINKKQGVYKGKH